MGNATTWICAASDHACRPLVEWAARKFCTVLGTPEHFLEMLLYVEDKRFLVHFGIDPIAVSRALIFDLRGGALQGGSTICQQLYNIEGPRQGLPPAPRILSYKIKQAVWALRQEVTNSKVTVLDRYIRSVYWGRSYYGLDRAAQGYFSSTRSTLTAAQSFFLAERIASPNQVSWVRISNLLNRSVIAAKLRDYGVTGELLADIYIQAFGMKGVECQIPVR
jgi:membrane peptidoglycan carboxypeptidase